jgi:hypothetical protein
MGQASSVVFENSEIDQKEAPKTSHGYTAVLHPFNKSIVLFGGFPGYDPNIYELNMSDLKFKSSAKEITLKGSSPSPRFNHRYFKKTQF